MVRAELRKKRRIGRMVVMMTTGVNDKVTIEPSRSTEQSLGLRRMLCSRSQGSACAKLSESERR